MAGYAHGDGRAEVGAELARERDVGNQPRAGLLDLEGYLQGVEGRLGKGHVCGTHTPSPARGKGILIG